ncbi:DUF2382 domain-containing protein [Arthrobacter crystallopoietes]|uniref:hypothetical protein n=1 Tax=Crystallibacter crystallopoietes TaxID=37928 RepID=UPI003D1E90B3
MMQLRKRHPRARSARTISRQADRILEEARARERDYESKGFRSVTISRDDLIRELTHATEHSPFLTQIGRGPAERVRLEKDTVTDQETVSEEVRKERIETEGDTGRTGL